MEEEREELGDGGGVLKLVANLLRVRLWPVISANVISRYDRWSAREEAGRGGRDEWTLEVTYLPQRLGDIHTCKKNTGADISAQTKYELIRKSLRYKIIRNRNRILRKPLVSRPSVNNL